MDKDKIKGAAAQAKGSVQETLGRLSGNKGLETRGKIKGAEGSARKAFGKAKDVLRKG